MTTPAHGKVLLVILDGFGVAPAWGGNAISIAQMPNFNNIVKSYSYITLAASGTDVGLSGHEMGNSEVGHLNIGAGALPTLDGTLISQSIKDGSFFGNKVLNNTLTRAGANKAALHLIGLLSDGGIHSQISHLFALLDICQRKNITKVYIHLITDGRDTDPRQGIIFISRLQEKINQSGVGEIASLVGRYWAMDRDNHWERTDQAVNLYLNGCERTFTNPLKAISWSYSQGVTDEYVQPMTICPANQPPVTIGERDSVIIFNFRSDRVRQLQSRLIKLRPWATIATFVPYGLSPDVVGRIQSAFHPAPMAESLPRIISRLGSQYHVAETEKYAHVTYFFNGGSELPVANETRTLIPSERVSSYDTYPQMKSKEVTNAVIRRLRQTDDYLIVANFAAPDMIGHTGNLRATVAALEILDAQLGRLVEAAVQKSFYIILTADHGNAEQMINPVTGEIDTQHSANRVPFCLIAGRKLILHSNGRLSDIAPTILKLLNLPLPAAMTGKPLYD